MKRLQLEQNTDEWLEWRKGKITGSRLKNLIVKRGDGKKIGFYELLAERLSTDNSKVEDPMQRGHDLEQEAIEQFEELTGMKVNPDCGVWVSDEDEYIALSPDGEINEEEAVEVKCLASARHLQALIEQKIPSDYEEQVVQYFIVNEKLLALHCIFYDPRIACKPLHYITVNRVDIEDKIQSYAAYQRATLKEIDDIITELTF